MPISMLNELLAQQSKSLEPRVNQHSFAELDELAVPEFSRLYHPQPTEACESALSTVISQ